MPDITVDILILPNAMPSSVALTIDILRSANGLQSGKMLGAYGPSWNWRVCSPNGGMLPLGGGLSIGSEPMGSESHAELVIVPGLGIAEEEILLAQLSSKEGIAAIKWLQKAHSKGIVIAASCASTFLCAAAGILDGRRATTSWWLAQAMCQHYPNIQVHAEDIICIDGPAWTAGAALGHLDLCLRLVEHYADIAMAQAVSRLLLLPQAPRTQSAYMATEHLRRTDPLLLKAESWISENLEHSITVPKLAQALGKSPRTLARWFHKEAQMTPSGFITEVRMKIARRLLETSVHSVEEIGNAVGFSDVTAFWRAFRRHVKLTPAAYRKLWQNKPQTPVNS